MNKILLLLPTDAIGGAESNLKKLARHFLEQGYFLDIIFISGVNSSSWDDLNVYPSVNFVYLKSKRELFGFSRCFQYFLKRRFEGNAAYDFSFTSHTHCNAFVSMCATLKMLRIKKIVLRESTNVFSWFKGVKLKIIHALYLFYSRRSIVICQTNKMRLELLNNVTWINPDNVIVLENPVEVEVIERLSLDAFEDAVDILAVGRLVKEKAYDVLLDAFSLVLVRYPTRKLTIIGSGDQFEQISEKINALKLQDHVFLKGALKNPYVYMKHSNVSVLSSRLEGFPNVLFEMMTLSQSVVSTICADGIEALPGIYTSPVDSADQLADAIVAALEEDNKTKNDNILKMRAKVTSLTVPNFINSIFLKLDQNSSNILE